MPLLVAAFTLAVFSLSAGVWAAPRDPYGTCGQTETEPNDTAATATPIQLPGPASGLFTGTFGSVPAGDVDWFSFVAPPASRLWLAVDTGVASGGNRDTVLTLFAADGITVIEDEDDDGTGNGRDLTIETLHSSLVGGVPLVTGGTYFARVVSKIPLEPVEAYSLLIAVTDTPPVAEVEPNDTPPGPQTPVFAPVLGTLTSATDVDWYNVNVLDFGFPFVVVDGDPERDGVGTNNSLFFDVQFPPLGTIFTDSAGAGVAGNPPAEGFAIDVGLGFARVTGNFAGTYLLGVWYSGMCDVPVELQRVSVE